MDISLAFKAFDGSERGTLDYGQVQSLLMSYGIRPCEQNLLAHMRIDEYVSIERVSAILEILLPPKVCRRKLLRAFAFEDSQEERPIDGLLCPDRIVEVLQGWRLSDAEISDAFRGFMTSDGRLDYHRLVNDLWPQK